MLARLKNLTRIWLTASLALAAITVVGCKKKSGAEATPPATSKASTHSADPGDLEWITATEEKERDDFQADIRESGINGDFQKLESLATEFRSRKTRFPSGYWKLRGFYVAFGDYEKFDSEATYLGLINQLKRWAAQQPDSITPRLALVEAYQGYAWMARGTETANRVTEEGWRLMEERKKEGFDWLRQARALPQKDPALQATALRICLGANVPREDYEKIFEAGIQAAPDYDALYLYKAYYLLPRWYGEAGEWEAYARKITRRKDIPGSEEIFARIAVYLRDIGCFYDEFSYDDQSWEELKSSFHAVEKNYPDSIEVKNICCLMAAKLRDYQETREQMKLLNGKVDLSVWGDKDNFLRTIQWMNLDDDALEKARLRFKAQPHQ